MSRLTIEQIRAIRDQQSIVELLGRYGVTPPPRWNGASDFMVNCPCPNHDDRKPSCMIHPQTDRYYCFGCGAHGDVLQLVQDVEGIRSLGEVAERLSRQHPVTVREPIGPAVETRSGRTALERVLEVNDAAWHVLTSASASATARRYLASRGLDITPLEARAGQPLAGYTPAQPDGLSSRLVALGFTSVEVVDAGWAVERGNQLRDRFRRRVVLPVSDASGALRGVIARDITGLAQCRYINTPSTVAFRKGSLLYSPIPARPDEIVVVCEGPLDALAVALRSAEEPGLATVAPSGTALTREHVDSILALNPTKIMLCPDGDDAGRAAGARWTAQFSEIGVATTLLDIPPGHDPVSLLTIGVELSDPLKRCGRAIEI